MRMQIPVDCGCRQRSQESAVNSYTSVQMSLTGKQRSCCVLRTNQKHLVRLHAAQPRLIYVTHSALRVSAKAPSDLRHIRYGYSPAFTNWELQIIRCWLDVRLAGHPSMSRCKADKVLTKNARFEKQPGRPLTDGATGVSWPS